MPLPRYGVVIGTFVSFARDPQDQFGHWYHGHLTISTPAGDYRSALDVDTPTGIGISYRVSRRLSPRQLSPVDQLSDGWHPLASTPHSGAADYLRSPLFQDRLFGWTLQPPAPGLPWPTATPGRRWVDGTLAHLMRLLGRLGQAWLSGRGIRPWMESTGDNALTALETELPGSKRIFVFGDHFRDGKGVHDVHRNQGDPEGSRWWELNGIWQDGAVFVQRQDDSLFAWQVRFNTQSMNTDEEGHPHRDEG